MIDGNWHDVDREAEIDKILKDLHEWFLRSNYLDEGDLLYYRINYRLADAFGITKEDAERHHSRYHLDKPRQISKGYCQECDKIVTVIPIIYGIQESETEKMKLAEREGRLIIGNLPPIGHQTEIPMFGCKICKSPLPKYCTI